MSTVSTTHDHAHDHAHDDHTPHGWRRWLFATNHKDIGTMYLIFSFVSLLAGGVMALGIRLELFQPGLQFLRPEFFNQLTTMHGLVMVFGAIMPAFVGFANWMVPLQIGASDMAFARMNNFSFWILPVAATLLLSSFLVPGGAPSGGWTIYAPLTSQMGPGMDMAIFALHLLGASSIMGSPRTSVSARKPNANSRERWRSWRRNATSSPTCRRGGDMMTPDEHAALYPPALPVFKPSLPDGLFEIVVIAPTRERERERAQDEATTRVALALFNRKRPSVDDLLACDPNVLRNFRHGWRDGKPPPLTPDSFAKAMGRRAWWDLPEMRINIEEPSGGAWRPRFMCRRP